MSNSTQAIGIDIGGTRIKAVLCDAAGTILERRLSDTADAKNGWLAALHELVDTLEREHGPAAVGISCPGIARPDGSGISWMAGRMNGVVGFDFRAHLSRSAPVPVLNDGAAALYGETWCGAAKGLADVVLYTLGTGVGGAIMAGGRLLTGHRGLAGHLGHMTIDAAGPADICNTPGSIEHAIGNYSLTQRSGGVYSSTEALVQAVHAGDRQAIALWADSIRKLAAAIASIINAVDPERIIIGGGMIAAGASLFDALNAELARVEWRPFGKGVPVVPALLGEWAGAIGAVRNVLEQGNT